MISPFWSFVLIASPYVSSYFYSSRSFSSSVSVRSGFELQLKINSLMTGEEVKRLLERLLPKGVWFVICPVRGNEYLFDIWICYKGSKRALCSILVSSFFNIVFFSRRKPLALSLSKVFLTYNDYLFSGILEGDLFDFVNRSKSICSYYHIKIDTPVEYNYDSLNVPMGYGERVVDCLRQFPNLDYSVSLPGIGLPTKKINVFVAFKRGINSNRAEEFFKILFGGICRNIEVNGFSSLSGIKASARPLLSHYGLDVIVIGGLEDYHFYPLMGAKLLRITPCKYFAICDREFGPPKKK